MISGSCHCGAVHVEVPRRPPSVTNCNCSICRRYGVLWAYYQAKDVRIIAKPGATQKYRWGRNALDFVRCSSCGCVMAWQRVDPSKGTRTGINMRNFDPLMLGAVRIKLLDGASSMDYVVVEAPAS